MENEFHSPFKWNGNIKRIEYRRIAVCSGKLLDNAEMEFENGLMVKCNEYIGEILENSSTYEYNEKSQIIKKTSKSFFGTVDEVIEYFYDSEGHLVEEREFFDSKIKHDNINSQFIAKVVYEYDAEGKCIKELRYRDGELRGENIYKYDENGRVKEIHYGNWGNDSNTIKLFSYNEQGYLESLRQFEEGTDLDSNIDSYIDSYIDMFTYDYDEQGRVAVSTNYPPLHVARSYKDEDLNAYIIYSYDDHGNVISAQEEVGDNINYKSEWKIEYL